MDDIQLCKEITRLKKELQKLVSIPGMFSKIWSIILLEDDKDLILSGTEYILFLLYRDNEQFPDALTS